MASAARVITAASAAIMMPTVTAAPHSLLPTATNWYTVDDTVMGGVSRSSLSRTAESVVFEGHLALDHGRGFASVRWPVSLGDVDCMRLRVRGDGHTYRLTARRENEKLYFAQSFGTAPGAETELIAAASMLEPRWRGRHVHGAPSLDPAEVATLGLMIDRGPVPADDSSHEGSFRLEVLAFESCVDTKTLSPRHATTRLGPSDV
jgi:monofunctional biosynthetic peptidoglycan transglycosylase